MCVNLLKTSECTHKPERVEMREPDEYIDTSIEMIVKLLIPKRNEKCEVDLDRIRTQRKDTEDIAKLYPCVVKFLIYVLPTKG